MGGVVLFVFIEIMFGISAGVNLAEKNSDSFFACLLGTLLAAFLSFWFFWDWLEERKSNPLSKRISR